MLNSDYKDMLLALCEEKVEFIVVGAYALAAHGYLRATLDIDIWVMPASANATAVMRALKRFGAPTQHVAKKDFEVPGTIFQIGLAPRRIDIITKISGLTYDEARPRATPAVFDGIPLHVLSVEDLIINKRASGRPKDLIDVTTLETERKKAGKSAKKSSKKL